MFQNNSFGLFLMHSRETCVTTLCSLEHSGATALFVKRRGDVMRVSHFPKGKCVVP